MFELVESKLVRNTTHRMAPTLKSQFTLDPGYRMFAFEVHRMVIIVVKGCDQTQLSRAMWCLQVCIVDSMRQKSQALLLVLEFSACRNGYVKVLGSNIHEHYMIQKYITSMAQSIDA